MLNWNRHGDDLLLSLSPEGVRFLREQWSWLRELVRWQLSAATDDPLAALTGLPVPTGSIDGRLAYVVDYWSGTDDPAPVRRVREAWVLHDVERGLARALASLPRHGGVVRLPERIDGATAEWASMIETLHVVLDVSGRVNAAGDPGRVLPPEPGPAEAADYRRSLLWLELVLEVLVEAGRTAQAPAGD
ncbi:MAG: hypothetical protein GEV09_20040 [Pseudonocardiaceae bacterium]|nr:hypothetical protein [Pseudonocardiaceae bacterium]